MPTLEQIKIEQDRQGALLKDQGVLLRDIHHAVSGNPTMGQRGILPRLEDLEKHAEQTKKFKWWLMGASAGSGTLAGALGWPALKKFCASLLFLLKGG